MRNQTVVPDELKALMQITAGLSKLKESKQSPADSSGKPPMTVADQMQQQGIAALGQDQSMSFPEVVQNVPSTPMQQAAMQAGIGSQIKAREQAEAQQAAIQMAQAQQQAPQQMARGGIAELPARNMQNFQRGGVVAFNGEKQSWVDSFPEEALIRDIAKFLSKSDDSIKDYDAQQRAKFEQLYPIPQTTIELGPRPEVIGEEAASPPGKATPPVVQPAMTQQMPRAASPKAGLASLPVANRVDEKEALALAALQSKVEQQPKTTEQMRAQREAEAQATGVDLYGKESKARTSAFEQEFANQEAARAEANKSRGMDNLITMLTNSGGAPTLFAGLAKGTQAYQAAEKLQKADDLIWGGKKLQFMEKINEQKDLLNERNKAMMIGDINTANQIDEAIRLSKNQTKQQVADVYKESMKESNQAAIHAATNASNLAIAKLKADSEAASRKLAKEGQDYNAMESRILENSKLNSAANKLLDAQFDALLPVKIEKIKDLSKEQRSPEAQAKWDAMKADHEAAKQKQSAFFDKQNYDVSYRKWMMFDKALGLPEPINPAAPAKLSSGKNRPGYAVVPD